MPAFVINPNNSGTISIALEGITPLVQYSCQITNMMLEPAGTTQEVAGTYCQAAFDIPDGQSKWTMVVSFLQDWGATPSLSEFSMTNDGELCDFSFVPDVDDVPTMTGQVYIQATPYGGPAGGAWLGGPFRWPMKGEPTLTPAA